MNLTKVFWFLRCCCAHPRRWRLLAALLLLVTGHGQELNAQTNTLPGRRYLLIVETSKSMDRRLAGLTQTIQQMLSSGLRGELRQGDTLGVWTFNTALFTGQFPLQHFSTRAQPAITADLIAFLKRQKYEGSAEWPKVLPAMQHVVQGSPVLTILLVTAGTEAVQGTPFDSQINAALSSWREPQQTARMPVMIVLRAQAGKITNWSVTAAPWPIELPPLPAEKLPPALVASAAPNHRTNTAPSKPPPPLAQPLIVIGKKPQPVIPATPTVPDAAILTSPGPAQGQVVTNVESVAQTAASQQPSANPITAPPATSVAAATIAHANPINNGVPEIPAAKASDAPGSIVSNTAPARISPRSVATIDPASQTQPATAATPVANPAQVASASPLLSSSHRSLLPLIAIAGLAAGLIAMFLFWRRSHRPEHVSLITRSFERQQNALASDSPQSDTEHKF